jgi:hypothetical protein
MLHRSPARNGFPAGSIAMARIRRIKSRPYGMKPEGMRTRLLRGQAAAGAGRPRGFD